MTTDTDKELINQLTNLKREMVERMGELEVRGYEVSVTAPDDVPAGNSATFVIHISKTIKTEEMI